MLNEGHCRAKRSEKKKWRGKSRAREERQKLEPSSNQILGGGGADCEVGKKRRAKEKTKKQQKTGEPIKKNLHRQETLTWGRKKKQAFEARQRTEITEVSVVYNKGERPCSRKKVGAQARRKKCFGQRSKAVKVDSKKGSKKGTRSSPEQNLTTQRCSVIPRGPGTAAVHVTRKERKGPKKKQRKPARGETRFPETLSVKGQGGGSQSLKKKKNKGEGFLKKNFKVKKLKNQENVDEKKKRTGTLTQNKEVDRPKTTGQMRKYWGL